MSGVGTWQPESLFGGLGDYFGGIDLVGAERESNDGVAMVPLPHVLAGARPSALLASAQFPLVLADARPSALLAPAPSPIVLALPRLPPSCSLPSPAAPSLVSVWRRPLTPAPFTLLFRSAPAA